MWKQTGPFTHWKNLCLEALKQFFQCNNAIFLEMIEMANAKDSGFQSSMSEIAIQEKMNRTERYNNLD